MGLAALTAVLAVAVAMPSLFTGTETVNLVASDQSPLDPPKPAKPVDPTSVSDSLDPPLDPRSIDTPVKSVDRKSSDHPITIPDRKSSDHPSKIPDRNSSDNPPTKILDPPRTAHDPSRTNGRSSSRDATSALLSPSATSSLRPNGAVAETKWSERNGMGTVSGSTYIVNALPNGRSSNSSDHSALSANPRSVPSRSTPPAHDTSEHSPNSNSKSTTAPPSQSTASPSGQKLADSRPPSSAEHNVSNRMPPPSPLRSRHRRAQSASNPGSSPLAASSSLADGSSTGAAAFANRLSSTSQLDPPVAPAQSGSSLMVPRPPSLRLPHRHTLQVPRFPIKRASRDIVLQHNNNSADAVNSPAVGSLPRPSLSLGRRHTRSIHSEIFLDEAAPPDADAARWTEAVRQKRMSRRRRKEEEEDDRVMVGTKVDQNHVNWVTAYNMLTGIRFTVSRTNAKLDRELSDQDFKAQHKFSFDITGNELTPSAKYDFKFKDYAPWVFRRLRAKFNIDPADYLVSLTSKYILSELGSPGKSGSFFYFSRDYKYIIKTIHHAEHKVLRRILHDYYNHVCSNPNTLISQFYGLHRVKMPYGRKIHFVVMNNLFPPHRDIHQTFDLKGSTIGREFKEENLATNPRATLKDLNWLRRSYHIELGPSKKQEFVDQMLRDVALLQRLKIMDYSLLIGIHDLAKGNDEKLRDKTLQVFEPGSDRMDESKITALVRTPSKLENARKARELRQMIKREKPVPMDKSTFQMPEQIHEPKTSMFYSEDGGLRATHEDGSPGDEIYYLGIIDCLTHYGLVKHLEHFIKGLNYDQTQISAVKPELYGERFVNFITGVTLSREAAEQAPGARRPSVATDAILESVNNSSPPTATRTAPAAHRVSTAAAERTVEKAERQAQKTSSASGSPTDPNGPTIAGSGSNLTPVATNTSHGSSGGLEGVDSSPDRVLTSQSVTPPGVTLPVVEEVGEGGSTGSRSRERGESERDSVAGSLTRPKSGLDQARKSNATMDLSPTDKSRNKVQSDYLDGAGNVQPSSSMVVGSRLSASKKSPAESHANGGTVLDAGVLSAEPVSVPSLMEQGVDIPAASGVSNPPPSNPLSATDVSRSLQSDSNDVNHVNAIQASSPPNSAPI